MSDFAGGVVWKIRRIRAMTFKEVAWRIKQSVWCVVERGLVVVCGWKPRTSSSVQLSITLFSQQNEVPIASSHGAAIRMLKAGKIDFFGGSPLDVGIPIRWHFDPKTQQSSPLNYGPFINYRNSDVVGDAKYLWELGRQQHLVAMACHYVKYGDIAVKKHIVDEIESWIDENPFAIGIHWCSTLEVALRLISWSIVHGQLLMRDGGNGLLGATRKRDALEQAIYQQQWFIRHHLSQHSSANNHLIGELSGLWVSCTVFPFDEAKQRKWAIFAHKQLEKEAQLQTYNDGVNKEQAIYYHLWVLEYFLFVHCVATRVGQPFSVLFEKRIVAMATFLRDTMPSGGIPAQVGDSDNGFVARFDACWPEYPYHDVLLAVAYVFARPDLAVKCVGHEGIKAYWYAMMVDATPLIQDYEVEASRDYPRVYPDGGYVFLGNARCHLLFDAGRLGYPSIAAHGHADALSFCFAVDGFWWLVDPGTFAYHTESKWRNYFRGTSAHNTLTVDGMDQSQSGGPFLWLRHANASLLQYDVRDGIQSATGSHSGYKHLGVYHQRRVSFATTENTIYLDDVISGSTSRQLKVYFHLAPEVQVKAHEDGWLLYRKGTSTQLFFTGHCVERKLSWVILKASKDPIGGWFSSSLGTKKMCTTLVASASGMLPAHISFCLKILS